MKTWIAAALACVNAGLLTVPHAAAQETVQLQPSPMVLPTRIGPLLYAGAPHEYQDPALGVSYQFAGDGLSLTVYVYDAGDRNLADGADTVAVCREYEIAKQGVTQAYQKIQLKGEQRVRLNPPDELPQAREAVYEYEREQRPTISFIWITAAAGHFLKLRLSMDPRLRDELPDARRALLSIVGDAVKPHLTPVDPEPPARYTAQGLDATAIRYLMLLESAAERSPQLAPVCGGEFVPSLATEARVLRDLFAPGEDPASTRLGKRFQQIEKAGFLEEFLWVERHRPAWGTTPPEELSLAGYQAWRKKNLKRFKAPDFGTLVLEHPRPLPLEPPRP
jgi:hypothetical protein